MNTILTDTIPIMAREVNASSKTIGLETTTIFIKLLALLPMIYEAGVIAGARSQDKHDAEQLAQDGKKEILDMLQKEGVPL